MVCHTNKPIMKKYLLSFLLVINSLNLFSQNDSLKSFPFQFTLISPVATSKHHSLQYNYNFSVSLISGRSGGIKGFEVGGISNYTKYNVYGFQTSGVANIVRKKVNGIQISGGLNYADKTTGAQIAGLVNLSRNEFKGLQIAGLISTANDTTNKHLLNEFNTQISGLYSKGKGFDQFVQISGLVSISEKIKAVQIAGLVNISEGNEGVQIAGIYNRSKNVKGIQIGFINIADSVDGFMLGAYNRSRKNGKYAFEFGSSDNLNLNARYVSGVNEFYNFISFGLKIKDGINWGYGLGIGLYSIQKSNYISFSEFSVHHITENKLWENRYSNFLFSYGYGIEFNSRGRGNFRIMPTINLYKARTKDGRLRPFPESNFAYYSTKLSNTLNDYHFWLGLNLSYKIKWDSK